MIQTDDTQMNWMSLCEIRSVIKGTDHCTNCLCKFKSCFICFLSQTLIVSRCSIYHFTLVHTQTDNDNVISINFQYKYYLIIIVVCVCACVFMVKNYNLLEILNCLKFIMYEFVNKYFLCKIDKRSGSVVNKKLRH